MPRTPYSRPTKCSRNFLGEKVEGVWADENADYFREVEIDLAKVFPVLACPHHVDNVKGIAEVAGTPIQQALVGTCTNGRLDDLQAAAAVLKGKKIPKSVQLLVIPASKAIYLEAMKDGTIETLINAGANILSPSCGPCLGTGQGIPADGINVISTANRNFLGRMGNKAASIYLGSPVTVAVSALNGKITDPRAVAGNREVRLRTEAERHGRGLRRRQSPHRRRLETTTDVDNLNTDQMFAGNLTYNINSSEPDKVAQHLFKGFDDNFAERVQQGDIILAGDNFGCGSSREHPSVGLAYAGVKAVIVKSVARIFFRSAINQGLPIIVLTRGRRCLQAGRQGR